MNLVSVPFITFMIMQQHVQLIGPCQANLVLSPMRAAKVQASLRIRAVSPEPSLLAHRSSESRETFRQKARSLPPLNGWACAVEICHDGMLEDTNSLDGAIKVYFVSTPLKTKVWKISRVSISITGARTVHWNWEQNTCIAK